MNSKKTFFLFILLSAISFSIKAEKMPTLSSAALASGERCFYSGEGREVLKLKATLDLASFIDQKTGIEYPLKVLPATKSELADGTAFIARRKAHPNSLFARDDLKTVTQFSVTTPDELANINELFPETLPESRPYMVQKILVLQTLSDKKLHLFTSQFVRATDQVGGLNQAMVEVECSLQLVERQTQSYDIIYKK